MIIHYDPKTCVQVGTLRDMGIAVPDDIPDCAWTPRDSMRMIINNHLADDQVICCDDRGIPLAKGCDPTLVQSLMANTKIAQALIAKFQDECKHEWGMMVPDKCTRYGLGVIDVEGNVSNE